VLDYANPQAGQPLNSRLIFERFEDGVRFTAPPLGWAAVRGNVVLCAMGAILCVVLIVALIAAAGHGRMGDVLGYVAALLATVSASSFGYSNAKARATKPTVVEVRGGALRVQFAHLSAPMSWPAHRLSDVRATVPMLGIAPFTMVCDLLIQPRFRFGVRVLRDRRVVEIKWVVGELRHALKL
jgi:hypothetical protein